MTVVHKAEGSSTGKGKRQADPSTSTVAKKTKETKDGNEEEEEGAACGPIEFAFSTEQSALELLCLARQELAAMHQPVAEDDDCHHSEKDYKDQARNIIISLLELALEKQKNDPESEPCITALCWAELGCFLPLEDYLLLAIPVLESSIAAGTCPSEELKDLAGGMVGLRQALARCSVKALTLLAAKALEAEDADSDEDDENVRPYSGNGSNAISVKEQNAFTLAKKHTLDYLSSDSNASGDQLRRQFLDYAFLLNQRTPSQAVDYLAIQVVGLVQDILSLSMEATVSTDSLVAKSKCLYLKACISTRKVEEEDDQSTAASLCLENEIKLCIQSIESVLKTVNTSYADDAEKTRASIDTEDLFDLYYILAQINLMLSLHASDEDDAIKAMDSSVEALQKAHGLKPQDEEVHAQLAQLLQENED